MDYEKINKAISILYEGEPNADYMSTGLFILGHSRHENETLEQAADRIIDENAVTNKVANHVEDEHQIYDSCICCNGTGEHYETGFECYRCDASGLEDNVDGPVPCDGREDSPNIVKDKDGGYEHAKNATVGNPYHDKLGRFTTGAGGGRITSDMSPVHFADAIGKRYGKQATWSDNEKQAIDDYTKTYTSLQLNLYMRGKTKDVNYPENTKEYKDLANTLNGAMKNTLTSDTALYRGMGITHTLAVGSVIHDKGFASASFNKTIASHFAKHGVGFSTTKRPVVIKINAKKGQKGLIPQLTSTDSTSDSLRSNEQEFLFPSGNTYIIRKVYDRGDYEEVEVDIK